jgi:UPF0271 protein
MPSIDINSDLAEGFGQYLCGDDDAMLAIVTSANVACGFHAGDPEIMARTFKIAKERGVTVGAHPAFPISGDLGAAEFHFRSGRSSDYLPTNSAPPRRLRLIQGIASPM